MKRMFVGGGDFNRMKTLLETFYDKKLGNHAHIYIVWLSYLMSHTEHSLEVMDLISKEINEIFCELSNMLKRSSQFCSIYTARYTVRVEKKKYFIFRKNVSFKTKNA